MTVWRRIQGLIDPGGPGGFHGGGFEAALAVPGPLDSRAARGEMSGIDLGRRDRTR